MMNRREFLRKSLIFTGAFNLNTQSFAQPISNSLNNLDIFNQSYPKTFIFRQSEAFVSRLSYDEWEALFLPFSGILGKVLREERGDTVTANNIDYFSRFKKNHPKKVVLAHINGRARLPDFELGSFFPGHWLYRVGTVLTRSISTNELETILHVENTNIFSLRNGLFANAPDDICIIRREYTGQLNWFESEYVKLVEINKLNSTITVKRATYGTKPLNFDRGSYLAPHILLGPWCEGCDLLWSYNFSLDGPKDHLGRSAIDIFAESIASKFESGALLSNFDGIQLDVFGFQPPQRLAVDIDHDKMIDGGVVGSINSYGLGTLQLLEVLRHRLGNNKLILTDGGIGNFQRPSYKYINGIEMEGFPKIEGPIMKHWMTGLNLLAFWYAHASDPALSYVNHKYDSDRSFPTNYSAFRMVLAATHFSEAAFTFFIEPNGGILSLLKSTSSKKPGLENIMTIFDEIQIRDQEVNWLGNPIGPAIHLAETSDDLLNFEGGIGSSQFIQSVSNKNPSLNIIPYEKGIKIECPSNDKEIILKLPNLGDIKGDVLIKVLFKTFPFREYSNVGREVNLQLKPEKDKGMALIGETPYYARFYFRDIFGNVEPQFTFEGCDPIIIEDLSVYSMQNGIYRLFESGLVLANPSTKSFIFNLKGIFGKEKFQRLKGSLEQDPLTNNGAEIGEAVELNAEDALFLSRIR